VDTCVGDFENIVWGVYVVFSISQRSASTLHVATFVWTKITCLENRIILYL
jgi:hypothetical protein